MNGVFHTNLFRSNPERFVSHAEMLGQIDSDLASGALIVVRKNEQSITYGSPEEKVWWRRAVAALKLGLRVHFGRGY